MPATSTKSRASTLKAATAPAPTPNVARTRRPEVAEKRALDAPTYPRKLAGTVEVAIFYDGKMVGKRLPLNQIVTKGQFDASGALVGGGKPAHEIHGSAVIAGAEVSLQMFVTEKPPQAAKSRLF